MTYLFAVVAGFVGNVVAYFLLEELIFKSYLTTAVYEPAGATQGGSIILPLIAVIAMVLIMAYIYPKGYEGGSPAAEGLRFGILMGLFLGIPFAFFFGALFSIGFGAIVVLALLAVLELAASGLLIGLVYGRVKRRAAVSS